MGLFRRLTEKPWLVTDLESDAPAEDMPSAAPTGLWVYFAVATVTFSLITVAYLMRMGFWHPGMAGLDWRATPEPFLLWINTGVLVVSSMIFQRARSALRQGNRVSLERALYGAGLFTLAFLAGQLVAWRELLDAGYYLTNNVANAFFYLITTLHGLHVVGGLVAWGLTMSRLRQGAELSKLRVSVDLCAVYWHFLLIVWLGFFYLLLIT